MIKYFNKKIKFLTTIYHSNFLILPAATSRGETTRSNAIVEIQNFSMTLKPNYAYTTNPAHLIAL